MSPTDESEIRNAIALIEAANMPYCAEVMRLALSLIKGAESDLSSAREEIARVTEERDAAHTDIDTLMKASNDLAEEVVSLATRIAALEEALKPFGAQADCWDGDADDVSITTCNPDGFTAALDFTIGDLRKARAVLSGGNGE